MKLYITIPALVAAGLLSACNSSSNISQIDGVIGFSEAVDEADFETLTAADLPDNATMNGYLAAAQNLEGTTVYVGDATADFNFESGNLSGSASNFNEYELAETCADDGGACTGEQTRSLDGSMVITGDINGTNFDYYAFGGLSSEDEELGTLTAEVYVGGEGAIGTLNDKLIAVGQGGGDVYLSSSEEGYLGYSSLESILVLQE